MDMYWYKLMVRVEVCGLVLRIIEVMIYLVKELIKFSRFMIVRMGVVNGRMRVKNIWVWLVLFICVVLLRDCGMVLKNLYMR